MTLQQAYAVLANCKSFYYAEAFIMEAWRVANAS